MTNAFFDAQSEKPADDVSLDADKEKQRKNDDIFIVYPVQTMIYLLGIQSQPFNSVSICVLHATLLSG